MSPSPDLMFLLLKLNVQWNLKPVISCIPKGLNKIESESEVAQSCPTLCDPMDWSLPGLSVHGIFQAGVLGWGAIASSRAWPQGAASPLKPQPEAQPQASECCPTPDGHSREKQSGSRLKAPCPAGLHTGGLHHHTKLNSGSSHTHPAPRFL